MSASGCRKHSLCCPTGARYGPCCCRGAKTKWPPRASMGRKVERIGVLRGSVLYFWLVQRSFALRYTLVVCAVYLHSNKLLWEPAGQVVGERGHSEDGDKQRVVVDVRTALCCCSIPTSLVLHRCCSDLHFSLSLAPSPCWGRLSSIQNARVTAVAATCCIFASVDGEACGS